MLCDFKNVSNFWAINLTPLFADSSLIFFRAIDKNEVFVSGGRYKNEELTSVGFAIYTDILCETLSK